MRILVVSICIFMASCSEPSSTANQVNSNPSSNTSQVTSKPKSKSNKINKAEFKSLSSCLSAIKSATNTTIRFTSKDTPTNVVGTLSNGETFWCKEKHTGTKGRYFEGAFYGD
jgi:hypothetical protein